MVWAKFTGLFLFPQVDLFDCKIRIVIVDLPQLFDFSSTHNARNSNLSPLPINLAV
jgi:hypothetical protein